LEKVVVYFKAFTAILAERTEVNHEANPVRMAVPPPISMEIQTGDQ
jgi:hypothetical protein